MAQNDFDRDISMNKNDIDRYIFLAENGIDRDIQISLWLKIILTDRESLKKQKERFCDT